MGIRTIPIPIRTIDMCTLAFHTLMMNLQSMLSRNKRIIGITVATLKGIIRI